MSCAERAYRRAVARAYPEGSNFLGSAGHSESEPVRQCGRPFSRVTPEMVLRLRQFFANHRGWGWARIGRRFGVDPNLVRYHVRSGKDMP